MHGTWIIVLLAVAGVLVAASVRRSARRDDSVEGYRLKAEVMSSSERTFLRILDAAVAQRFRIHAQIRVADVLEPTVKRSNRSAWQSAQNRIHGKHFDFLLSDPANGAPKLAIELDDSSHRRKDRIDRDMFLNNACKSAALPLLRIDAQRSYDIAKLTQQLEQFLGADPSPSASTSQSATPASIASSAAIQPPVCPRCGAATRMRVGEAGTLAGRPFWGCTADRCLGLIAID